MVNHTVLRLVRTFYGQNDRLAHNRIQVVLMEMRGADSESHAHQESAGKEGEVNRRGRGRDVGLDSQ
jgi:hypothetical protein